MKIKMSSFKSNENIHKKDDGSYYVVSANRLSWDFKPFQQPFSHVELLRIHGAKPVVDILKLCCKAPCKSTDFAEPGEHGHLNNQFTS